MVTKRFIYYDNKLRCRIRKTIFEKKMELQLQRKSFWFFWINCYPWMHICEGFWGENWGPRINPLKIDYVCGNISESWITGTLNIRTRIQKLFGEYFEQEKAKQKFNKEFQSI